MDATQGPDPCDVYTEKAFRLLHSPAVGEAFHLGLEDPKLRDRYGRNKLGQSVLLARRLVETGVRFVMVYDGQHNGQVANSARAISWAPTPTPTPSRPPISPLLSSGGSASTWRTRSATSPAAPTSSPTASPSGRCSGDFSVVAELQSESMMRPCLFTALDVCCSCIEARTSD
jgi:Protein of unknown function (DUF1501)